MAPEGLKRKISAILSADVAGYSKLMEVDEETTVRTMESYRKSVSSIIEQHNGRVVDSPGDNLLAEFGSVVDAAQCSVEIQHVIKAKNAVIPEARRMQFRIGISLEDVIEEGERIYGDGVNIASRIEGLADAGGICISGAAYEQIKRKLALGYEDLGEHSVKNISWPVQVYRIPLDSGVAAETGKDGGASLPEKPSIAVLRFDNMSGDPEQEYFVDGMTEEILNGLAKNPGLIVKARTSSFSSKVKDKDARTIGELLNVTHVVEGSVRKAANRIRVTAQLIAADEDAHIWSEKYDRELTDIFEIQDDIAAAILEELSIRLLPSGGARMPTTVLEAYNAYLLGQYQANHHRLREAERSYERAISLDPEYADAYGGLAGVHCTHLWWGHGPIDERLPSIQRCIGRALERNPKQPDARNAAAQIRFFADRAYQDAIADFSGLIQESPNDCGLLEIYAYVMQTIGRSDLALVLSDKAVGLDPLSPDRHLVHGVVLLGMARFEGARQSFEKMAGLGLAEAMPFAYMAFLADDVAGIQTQLNRGREYWGNASDTYPLYEAAIPYLKGHHAEVREVLDPLKRTAVYDSPGTKTAIASLEGDLEGALDSYSQAVSESDFSAIRNIHKPRWFVKTHPEYRSHPKYQKMLRDVGLDEESIGKLKIPPLPF